MRRLPRLLPRFGPDAQRPRPSEDGATPRIRPREPEAAPPAGPSPARRLLEPLPLLGAALVLIALIGYWSVYTATTDRTPVLVAARDLPAGAVLRAGDLRAAEVAGEEVLVASLVPEGELGSVLKRQLGAPLGRGAPLSSAALTQQPRSASLFTLSVGARSSPAASARAIASPSWPPSPRGRAGRWHARSGAASAWSRSGMPRASRARAPRFR